MQINVTLADWKEVLRRESAGTLEQDLTADDSESWTCDPDSWWSDSSIQFYNLEEAYAAMAPQLPPDNRRNADDSIGKLFRMDAVYDLDTQMECWFMAISPKCLKRILDSLAAVDFSPFRELYDQHCPESVKSGLTDDDYQENFYSYIIQWRDAMSNSLDRGWGLLGHIG